MIFWILNKIINRYITLHIDGTENILHDQPFIICSNHSSHIDSFIIIKSLGRNFSSYAFLAASDYWFENKLRKIIFANLLNLIPINRSQNKNRIVSLKSSLKLCKNFVSKNPDARFVIYANGTRNPYIKEVKPGVIIISKYLKLPILPVQICGTDNIMRKGHKFLNSGHVKVNIYPAIFPELSNTNINKIEKDNILIKIKDILY